MQLRGDVLMSVLARARTRKELRWACGASALVLWFLLVSGLVAASAQEPLPPEEPPQPFSTPLVQTGEIVLTRQMSGEVVAIDADRDVRVLASGLAGPRGVVVLSDGSVVVAESGAGQIVGIGGRYPAEPTPIVAYPMPGGLHLLPGGRLLVTSFAEGLVGELDLATSQIVTVGSGLEGPLGVTVRAEATFVTEFAVGWLTRVGIEGANDRVAGDFARPAGIVPAPGDGFFVTDTEVGALVRVDGEGRRVIAELTVPGDLQVLVVDPESGEAVLLVATGDGLVSVETLEGNVQVLVDLPDLTGLAMVGEVVAPPPPPAEGSTEANDAQAEVAEQEASQTPAGGRAADAPDVQVSSFLPVILAGLGILVVVGVVFFFQVRGARRDERELDLNEHASSSHSIEDALGPWAAEELDLERAEAALAVVEGQLERARQRSEDTAAELLASTKAIADGREERERAQLAHQAAVLRGEAEAMDPHPIHLAEPLLRTEEGRAALAAYRAGTLSPLAMAQRWEEMGEIAAIQRVRQEGVRARQPDPSVPGPAERRLMGELAAAEAAVLEARDDVVRFTTREQDCRAAVWAARARVSAVHPESESEPHIEAPADGEDSEQVEAWGQPPPGDPPTG